MANIRLSSHPGPPLIYFPFNETDYLYYKLIESNLIIGTIRAD